MEVYYKGTKILILILRENQKLKTFLIVKVYYKGIKMIILVPVGLEPLSKLVFMRLCPLGQPN